MRKTLLAAILVTAAFAPVAATAQDAVWAGDKRGGDYNPDVAEQLASRTQDSPRPDRAERSGRAERPQFQPRQEAQAPQAQAPAPQQTARDGGGRRNWGDRGNSGGNGGSDRGGRGGFRPDTQQAPVQAAPPAQPQRNDRGDNRGPRGFNDGRGFDGNRGQPGQRFEGNRGQYDRGQYDRGQYDRRAQPQQNRNWSGDRGGWNSDRTGTGNRGWSGNGRYDSRRPNFNRNWRSNQRYDWQRYRNSHRQTYRLPRYYAPYGWNAGYRNFAIGAYLDDALFARSYWIDSPYDYRLPEVEWPYRWVRYYNDALLVDTESGEVVDVIRDIFW